MSEHDIASLSQEIHTLKHSFATLEQKIDNLQLVIITRVIGTTNPTDIHQLLSLVPTTNLKRQYFKTLQ